MKTNFKVQNRSNIQKAVAKVVAAFIAVIFLTHSLNGQHFEMMKYNKSVLNKASLAMAGNHFEATSALTGKANNYSNLSSYTAKEAEAELELEAWMTDENYFGTNSHLETEIEAPLNLEPWMIDARSFNMNTKFAEVTEEILIVEPWMTDEKSFEVNERTKKEKSEKNDSHKVKKEHKIFSTKDFVYRELEEPALKFEAWMFDSKHFRIK